MNKKIRIPCTKLVADVQGWDFADGYAWADFPPLKGALLQLVMDNVTDLETDPILILDKETQSEKIISESMKRLSENNGRLDDFVDDLEGITDDLEGHISRRYLGHRDTKRFIFQPMDNVSMSASLWLASELGRARRQGLIFDVNGAQPSRGVLESMGNKLVRYAIKKGLVKL